MLLVTYNGRDSKVVLLCVIKELEDIVTNDDSGLASEDVLSTHNCVCIFGSEYGDCVRCVAKCKGVIVLI